MYTVFTKDVRDILCLTLLFTTVICVILWRMGPIMLEKMNSEAYTTEHYSMTIEESISSQEVVPQQLLAVDYIAGFILNESSDRKVYSDLSKLYAKYYLTAARRFNLNVNELVSLGEIESDYDHRAISSANCIGIMQVNPSVWLEELVAQGLLDRAKDLYDPQINILCGAYIYRFYLDEGYRRGEDDVVSYAVMRYVGTSIEWIADHKDYSSHRYLKKWNEAMNKFVSYTFEEG